MRLPAWFFICVRACVCVYLARPRVCASVYERQRERYEGGCMYVCLVDVWEAVIWCTGVGVKADRMRIVIILVPCT